MMLYKKIIFTLLISCASTTSSFTYNTIESTQLATGVLAPASSLVGLWLHNNKEIALSSKLVTYASRIAHHLSSINLQKSKSPGLNQLFWILHYLCFASKTSHEFLSQPNDNDNAINFTDNIDILNFMSTKITLSALLLAEIYYSTSVTAEQHELLKKKIFDKQPLNEFGMNLLSSVNEIMLASNTPLEQNMLKLGMTLTLISFMFQEGKP